MWPKRKPVPIFGKEHSDNVAESAFLRQFFETESARTTLHGLEVLGQRAGQIHEGTIDIADQVSHGLAERLRFVKAELAILPQRIQHRTGELVCQAKEYLQRNQSQANNEVLSNHENTGDNLIYEAVQKARTVLADTRLVVLEIVACSLIALLALATDFSLTFLFFEDLYRGEDGHIVPGMLLAIILKSLLAVICAAILELADENLNARVRIALIFILSGAVVFFLFQFGQVQALVTTRSAVDTYFPWKIPSEQEAAKIPQLRREREEALKEKSEIEQKSELGRSDFIKCMKSFWLPFVLTTLTAALFCSKARRGLKRYKEKREAQDFLGYLAALREQETLYKKLGVEVSFLENEFQQLQIIRAVQKTYVQTYLRGVAWAECELVSMEAYLRDGRVWFWTWQIVFLKPIVFNRTEILRVRIDEAKASADRLLSFIENQDNLLLQRRAA